VSGYKKRIILLPAIIAISSIALTVISAQSSNNEPRLENSKSKTNILFANDPNFSMAANNNLGGSRIYFKMMLSILLIIALGIAAIYISKKLLPHTGLQGKEMRIIETVHLGPRKTVHLLKIGNQHLLIGSTAENITKLADVTDVLPQSHNHLADLPIQETDNNSRI
jgi:flagellar biosynthetic protein FliO